MLTGILAGLAAGALWGAVFIAPKAVLPFTEMDLAIGRYGAFALCSALLMAHPRFRPGRITWPLAAQALVLGMSGYVLYYLAAAYAVRWSGPAVPPLIIGALPVVLAIIGNWQEGNVRWRSLALPLVLISAGLFIVDIAARGQAPTQAARDAILWGIIASFAALAIWIAYALINARAMRAAHPPSSLAWTGLQGLGAGLAVLPLIPLAAFTGATSVGAVPLGSPEGLKFIAWCLALGAGASWLATWFWSIASKRLPLALSAQLIIAETLFGLSYGYLWEARWPASLEWAGAGLLILGVVIGVAVFSRAHGSQAVAQPHAG